MPGEDEEETESFRSRYLASFQAQSFGGNRADYLEKTEALPGVGGVRVFRAWNGGLDPAALALPQGWDSWFSALPEDTPPAVAAWLQAASQAAGEGLLVTGGVVRLLFLDSAFSPPTAELCEQVQQAVESAGKPGRGNGICAHRPHCAGGGRARRAGDGRGFAAI